MNAKIKELVRDHLITSEYTECGSQECYKYEFDETEYERKNAVTKEVLYNFWGYSPLSFFSFFYCFENSLHVTTSTRNQNPKI